MKDSTDRSKRSVERTLDRYMLRRKAIRDREDAARRGEHVTGTEIAWARLFLVTFLAALSVYVLVKLL